MKAAYLITPFLTWLFAGSLKFIINSIKAKKGAFNLIGYGGLPSNHSAIVCSSATIIALREGINSPAFCVALTLSFIVILDANNLRRQIGKQAEVINKLSMKTMESPLRERIGHTKVELMAGMLVGIATAYVSHCFLP